MDQKSAKTGDCKERVAYDLMEKIDELEAGRGPKGKERQHVLDLYAECLHAVNAGRTTEEIKKYHVGPKMV